MAAPVTALQPLRLPAGPSLLTAEQRYWRSFRSQQLIPAPHSSPVTHISHPPVPLNALQSAPDSFAVTSGGRVQIFSSRTRKLVKTISRFGVDDIAHSGEIRRDGRVLVAGGDSGAVQVFDANSRAILKTWKEHKQPVWTTRWNPSDPTSLMSTSDDRTVRLWDLPSQDSVTTFTGHQDYVRSGSFMPGQASNLLVTGSYDQTVRLWDPRAPDRSVMVFKHAAPVETVLPLPAGTTVLAASDNTISVLDLVAAKPQAVLKPHQKTITALSLTGNASRLVSGSLDGHVKILNTADWSVVAGSKYSSPILSLSIIPSPTAAQDPADANRHLAVGLQSGLLSLKTRLPGALKAASRAREQELSALAAGGADLAVHDARLARQARLTSGLRRRLRGTEYTGDGAALVVEGSERRAGAKLQPWQRALHGARYARALDLAVALQPPDPPAVFTLLRALEQRSALAAAVRGRDEAAVVPLLRWLVRHVSDPRHVALTARVGVLLVDFYRGEVGAGSAALDTLVERLHERVRDLVDGSQAATSTIGMLDTVMAGMPNDR